MYTSLALFLHSFVLPYPLIVLTFRNAFDIKAKNFFVFYLKANSR